MPLFIWQQEKESLSRIDRGEQLKMKKKIYIIGIGPGEQEYLTFQAMEALRACEVIVGYKTYNQLVQKFLPNKEYLETPMRGEVKRCQLAFEEANKGRLVAVISSGDAGIYGMAGLMYEIGVNYPEIELCVVPGITAANSGAAYLGAPLMHDFAVISLSDLLTPWEVIEKRLQMAAQSDFVIVLYNPSSHKRANYLQKACDILLTVLPDDRVCGYVRNIGRDESHIMICNLSELRERQVDMFTTVYIGKSTTRQINGKMVTPRGYKS